MGGLVDAVFGGGDSPPPPDYTPVAQASKEAAEISAKLGQAQLDEAKRQYDQNIAVAQPVVNAQLAVMQQGIAQGNDYYNYQKGFRPLEQAMLAQISGISSADMQRVQQMRSEAEAAARSTSQQQQDARRAQLQQEIAAAQAQEQQTAQATATAQAGQTGGGQFYIDAQGNVRTAEAYKGLREADTSQAGRLQFLSGQSPGEGYKLYQYDRDPSQSVDWGERSPIWARTGPNSVWLKTSGEPATAGATATAGAQGGSTTSRVSALQAQLDALDKEQFSGTVDYSAADAEQQRLTMAGMEAKKARDQAEIDAITGEVRANAGELMDRTRAYEQTAAADIALATGGNAGIAARYGADIENDVGTAMADARVGQTQALATAARQAARYGLAVPSNVQAVSNQNAAQLAAAANTTRNASTDKYRGLVMQGIGLKRDAFTTGQASTMDAMGKAEGATRAGRDMKIQQESLDWAKQLDVAGMARGMPGASQGAYGVAVSAGDSATRNQMAPGNALIGAMGQSAQTQMSGQQLAMQGLTGILGAQGQYNGQVSSANTARTGQMLDMIGTGLGVAFSDVRLKRDIVKVGDDPRGFGWYEFSYKGGDGSRHIGVMAQEVEQILPGAVTEIAGAKAVYYHLL